MKMDSEERINRIIADKLFDSPFRKPNHGSCCTCQACGHYYDEYYFGCMCNFCTGTEAAWAVVDKMDDCLHLRQHNGKGLWEAEFCGFLDAIGEADTPEMAICLAAEIALEQKRGN
jgi:hypothetical protein